MSEVVEFPRAHDEKPGYWVCDCGCWSFMLRSDGVSICAKCQGEASKTDEVSGWRDRLPIPPSSEEMASGYPQNITRMQSSEAARSSTLRSVDGETIALIVVQSNGEWRAWFGPTDLVSLAMVRGAALEAVDKEVKP